VLNKVENIVEITNDITINKDELKDAVIGSVRVSNKINRYDWDSLINKAIQYGVNLDEQTITVQSDDWCFTYHLITLDQLMGVGIHG